MVELARFVVHDGTDPFTPPQSKLDWVDTSIPGVKQPVIRWRRMISRVSVVVEGPEGDDVRNQFNACVTKAAVTSLVSGFVAGFASGGMAGLTTAMTSFVASLDNCVESALGRAVDITAHVDSDSRWSDWE